jgi:hypothetical protein
MQLAANVMSTPSVAAGGRRLSEPQPVRLWKGYTAEQLAKKFGPIRDYPRKPNTFNDDITYELCFLEAYAEKGRGFRLSI